MNWELILTALEKMAGMNFVLVIALVFVSGYLLKNFTKLSNKLIPWFLTALGVAGNLALSGASLANGIIGMVIAYVVMAFYEHIKNSLEYIVVKKSNP